MMGLIPFFIIMPKHKKFSSPETSVFLPCQINSLLSRKLRLLLIYLVKGRNLRDALGYQAT